MFVWEISKKIGGNIATFRAQNHWNRAINICYLLKVIKLPCRSFIVVAEPITALGLSRPQPNSDGAITLKSPICLFRTAFLNILRHLAVHFEYPVL